MANESLITVRGFIGSDLMQRESNSATCVEFRLGCTSGYRDRSNGMFMETGTNWFRVAAWGQIAENAAKSLSKGMPVLVRGRLQISRWTTSDGTERVSADINADSIGVELRNGVASYVKNSRPSTTRLEDPALSAAAEAFNINEKNCRNLKINIDDSTSPASKQVSDSKQYTTSYLVDGSEIFESENQLVGVGLAKSNSSSSSNSSVENEIIDIPIVKNKAKSVKTKSKNTDRNLVEVPFK